MLEFICMSQKQRLMALLWTQCHNVPSYKPVSLCSHYSTSICPFRNQNAEFGHLGWIRWAKEVGVFFVCLFVCFTNCKWSMESWNKTRSWWGGERIRSFCSEWKLFLEKIQIILCKFLSRFIFITAFFVGVLLLRVFEEGKYLLLQVIREKHQMIKSLVVDIWRQIKIFSQLSEFLVNYLNFSMGLANWLLLPIFDQIFSIMLLCLYLSQGIYRKWDTWYIPDVCGMANRHLQLQNSLFVHGNGSPIINKKKIKEMGWTRMYFTYTRMVTHHCLVKEWLHILELKCVLLWGALSQRQLKLGLPPCDAAQQL